MIINEEKIIISILIIGLIVVAGALSVSASNPTDILKSDNVNGIEVKDGKLYSTNKAHTEIGTVKMINSVDEGEKEIYGYDPEAIEKYVSDDPLRKSILLKMVLILLILVFIGCLVRMARFSWLLILLML